MKDLSIIILIDLYGKLLPATHLERLQEYYLNDLSINEIADNQSLSRQGVHDSITKSIAQLQSYENKLGISKKLDKIRRTLNETDYNTVLDIILQE